MKLATLPVEELAKHIYESEGKETKGEGRGLFLCPLSRLGERLAPILPFGKVLLVGDCDGFLRLGGDVRAALASYTLLSMAELSLPALFAFDDDVGAVIGLGSRSFAAVRYFAGVRSVPCICIPDTPDCSALISATVPVGKGEYPVPLPAAIVVDGSHLTDQAASYARICAASVRLIDCQTREVFLQEPYSPELFAMADHVIFGLKWYDPQFPLRLWEGEFRLAYCERAGLRGGNEVALARKLGEGSELVALEKLVRLYRLFLTQGYCRPYASPDYLRRIRLAGIPRAEAQRVHVPDRARLKRLEGLFQSKRHALYMSVSEIYARLPQMLRTYRCLGGTLKQIDVRKLKSAVFYLPECSDFSLLTLMRDFGLLEPVRRFRRVKKAG